jgi:glyoxylase-like metal-dependent hydrolase (beta-lactamase superfamily II)
MISVLQNGTLLRAPNGTILDAHSSITLIQSGGKNMIVDSGFPGDEDNIKKGLGAKGLAPKDIHLVINTHGHMDHTAGNKLFIEARFLIHPNEGGRNNAPPGCEVLEVDPPLTLDENISLIHTPGHSRGCISVVIKGMASEFSAPDEVIVCAGDALPIHGNYIQWVPPGIHYDREIALESMKRIVELADWIIPGHDKPFRVKK